MEEKIKVRVSSAQVWDAWKGKIEQGQASKTSFSYRILEIREGESFSILWKTLFVKLVFNHEVKPIPGGSEIFYKVQIKGFFAWPVRWILGAKIKKNLGVVLKAAVRELESQSVK